MSSTYAAPLELNLSPGAWERSALGLAALAAFSGILLSGASLPMKALLAVIAAAMAVVYWRSQQRRPQQLILYADGAVSCASDAGAQPAELLQSSSYLGLTQLQLRDFSGRRHSLVLFPDRVDGRVRHRLRVWLATHRPDPDVSGREPTAKEDLHHRHAVVAP